MTRGTASKTAAEPELIIEPQQMANVLSAAQLQELKRAFAGDGDNTAVCEAFSNAGLGLRRIRSEPYADDRPREDMPGEVGSAAEAALALSAEGTYGSVQQQNQIKVFGPCLKQLEDKQQQEEVEKDKGSGGSEAPTADAAAKPSP